MHAYLILTNNNEVDLINLIPNLYQPIHKHFFSKIKVDDVRTINSFLTTLGHESHVIYFDTFLDIAQNAFLKTLEEPSVDKQIILITNSKAGIYDTVLSRLTVIEDQENSHINQNNFAELSIIERLEVVKKILDSEHDKIRPNAQKLITDILNTKNSNSGSAVNIEQRQTLAEMYDHLFNAGSSPKQILEFIAVTL